MDSTSIYSLLTLGFSLGLIHALDADHIMAVSTMASGDRNTRSNNSATPSLLRSKQRTLRYCLNWAVGHGAVVLSLSMLFIFSKIQLPEMVSILAEKLIGLILICMGVWILTSIYRNRLTLKMHSHGDITHVHLSDPSENHGQSHSQSHEKSQNNHQPILVGITHGLAGSAPVLAIIPATGSAMGEAGALVALTYVALFCIGVICSMLVFGLFFGQLQNWIAGFGQKLLHTSRIVIAAISIWFGLYWVLQ